MVPVRNCSFLASKPSNFTCWLMLSPSNSCSCFSSCSFSYVRSSILRAFTSIERTSKLDKSGKLINLTSCFLSMCLLLVSSQVTNVNECCLLFQSLYRYNYMRQEPPFLLLLTIPMNYVILMKLPHLHKNHIIFCYSYLEDEK